MANNHNSTSPKKVISIWAPKELDDQLTQYAAQTGQAKGQLVQSALAMYLTQSSAPILEIVKSLQEELKQYFEYDLQQLHNLVASLDPNLNHTTAGLEQCLHKTSPKPKGQFSQSMEHNLAALFPLHEKYHIDLIALQAEALDNYNTTTNRSNRSQQQRNHNHTLTQNSGPTTLDVSPVSENAIEGQGAPVELEPGKYIEPNDTPLITKNEDTPEDALNLLTQLGPPTNNDNDNDNEETDFGF